ncbi:hypothetical protein GOP47_0001557 [Adiantum capillus-veneris]|uniref:Wall-associated receptor kinase galacturonan-binding domain-containing protein n=1 Tax=Adiantum capillus-veneris TaxID=13818 RepID=A0A9D4V965_ADICA|nr:hypothetical protein GOP47_0001557 [Adiantum capillus-veneris]
MMQQWRSRHIMLVAILLMESLAALAAFVHASPACSNTCGDIAISYPFGTAKGCGNTVFQNYAKCSKGKFLLTTHTGRYEVLRIAYEPQILIVKDKKLSTCGEMQRTSIGFGLQEGTPFTVQGPHIVLLACTSSSSIVQTSPTSLCDANGAQICQDLYGYCPSITNLGLSMNSDIRSCCLLTSAAMREGSPPFQIDPSSYGCLSYTSIYRFGLGEDFSSDYRNPNIWSYGIPLHFEYDEATYSPGCHICEASHGSCAFDDNSNFICVCPSGLNVTTECPPGSTSNKDTTRLSMMVSSIWMLGILTNLAKL